MHIVAVPAINQSKGMQPKPDDVFMGNGNSKRIYLKINKLKYLNFTLIKSNRF